MQPDAASNQLIPPDLEERLDAHLAAAGPAINATQIRRYPEGLWLLDFDDGLVVQIQPDPARATLVLTAALGAAPPGTELEAYRLMLELGAWWSVTGGLRMALDPGGDTLLQLDECPWADFDAAGLQARLLTFLARARAVQDELARLVPGEAERTAPDFASSPGLAANLRA